MESPEGDNGQRANGEIAAFASVCRIMPLFAVARAVFSRMSDQARGIPST